MFVECLLKCMFRIAPYTPLRHPLPEIQVCENREKRWREGEGRKIQSVMKNLLFQHLPPVLDDDAAGVAVSTAAVEAEYLDGFSVLFDRAGLNARQDGRHVSESV